MNVTATVNTRLRALLEKPPTAHAHKTDTKDASVARVGPEEKGECSEILFKVCIRCYSNKDEDYGPNVNSVHKTLNVIFNNAYIIYFNLCIMERMKLPSRAIPYGVRFFNQLNVSYVEERCAWSHLNKRLNITSSQ